MKALLLFLVLAVNTCPEAVIKVFNTCPEAVIKVYRGNGGYVYVRA